MLSGSVLALYQNLCSAAVLVQAVGVHAVFISAEIAERSSWLVAVHAIATLWR